MSFNLPKSTQGKIIYFWILGFAREYIENLFHISHGTIQNIVTEYTRVDPLIPLLRQIALVIKNAGLKIDEYAYNLRIIQAVARMGCPTDGIELFLRRLENEYISTKRPMEELVVTLSEISEVMALRGLSISQATDYMKDKTQKLMQLESETNHAQEMRIQSERELQSTLASNKVSMEKVNDFVAHKARLKKMGLTTNDFQRSYNTIMKLKKSGFDVKKIAPLLESNEDLEDRRDKLEKQCLEVSVTIRKQLEYKEKVLDYWRYNYDAFLKDYVWLITEHKVTKEEILSVVFALRNSFPYIPPSELVELIKMYGNMKSGITGMLGQYPFSRHLRI
jgi:hypothetical protein